MPDGADGLAAIASFLGQFPTLLSECRVLYPRNEVGNPVIKSETVE